MTRIGCIAATASGRAASAHLAALWPDEAEIVDEGTVADSLRQAFERCDAVISFLATGATVRILAPLLRHKTTDAPVVCVDEGRHFAIALLGGHYGANDLARRVAGALGAQPVISNARDAASIRPLPPLPALSLVVGVGASRGVSAREVLETVDGALARAGLDPAAVRALATVDIKADEPGIVAAAQDRGWPLLVHPASRLAEVDVPHPSAVVLAAAGTPSVAEAAARYAGPGRALGRLLVDKTKSPRENPMATAAVAAHQPESPEPVPHPAPQTGADRSAPQGPGRLVVIGLGPGARDLMAPRALDELRHADVVVGLDQYIDQIRDLLHPRQRIEASGLGAEERRARDAVALAKAGNRVALVGSGDAGVYAMASPALDDPGIEGLEVACVPGITAATAASNVLGAPLGHDHCAISLSDLHTPWPAIERRVRAAADADFVVSFYNPRSAKRDWQLPEALAILAEHRPPGTPVGWVRNAGRPDQSHGLATLAEFDPAVVDMYTTVIVGCSESRIVAGRFVTPRGYRWQP